MCSTFVEAAAGILFVVEHLLCRGVVFEAFLRKMRVHYLILIFVSCYSLATGFVFPSEADDELERDSEHAEGEKELSQDGNGLCTFEITYGF